MEKLVYLGVNAFGEKVYGDAAGGRTLKQGEETVSQWSSTLGFDPMSEFAHDRYKTVAEMVKYFCQQHSVTGAGSHGANGALLALLPGWEAQIAGGASLDALLGDIEATRLRLAEARDELANVLEALAPLVQR